MRGVANTDVFIKDMPWMMQMTYFNSVFVINIIWCFCLQLGAIVVVVVVLTIDAYEGDSTSVHVEQLDVLVFLVVVCSTVLMNL